MLSERSREKLLEELLYTIRNVIKGVSSQKLYEEDLKRALKRLGYEYIHVTKTTSTQDIAKKILKKNFRKSIIRADVQLSGRGRFGRVWYSPAGGLWITILDTGLDIYPNIIAPLAIVLFLKVQYNLEVSIKWPNDVYAYGKKLAGILVEAISEHPKVHYMIGIGINVNNDPPIEKATSLKRVIKREVNLNEILLGTVVYYELLKRIADPIVIFKRLCHSFMSWLLIKLVDGQEIVGKLLDVHKDGTAIVEDKEGRQKIVHASEVLYVLMLS